MHPARVILVLALLVSVGACRRDTTSEAVRPHDVPASVEAAPPRPAAARVKTYDLARDERRGGHTIERHCGRSDADLRDRLRRERNISAASTWTDRATAEATIPLVLAANSDRLSRWTGRSGQRPNLALDYEGDHALGRSLQRGAPAPVPASCANIVLRWDVRDAAWFVLTSYPEVCR